MQPPNLLKTDDQEGVRLAADGAVLGDSLVPHRLLQSLLLWPGFDTSGPSQLEVEEVGFPSRGLPL
jgi:hypothetical protein